MAIDSGPCANCGTVNSHSATKCRSCGEKLPWVKEAPVKAPKAAKSSSSGSPAWMMPLIVVAVIVALVGGGVFAYSRSPETVGGIGAVMGIITVRVGLRMGFRHLISSLFGGD